MARLPRHILLLFLCLLPVSALDKDFWAIDCGSSELYTTTTNTWEPDDGYVHGGVSRTVNVGDHILQTLRAFAADKPSKGCYTIPVGEGTQVLVQAWFYYGNYDGREDPPTFQLLFDANEWRSIQTSMDSWSYEEAIYVTTSNTTSICVARGRSGQTPFISGLTVAVLEDYMYDSVNASQALFLRDRVAFGASDYFRDRYRRIWMNSTLSLNFSDYNILTNTANVNTSDVADNPPFQVFQTAITATSAQSNITIITPYLPPIPKPIYFNLYFTDPENPAKPGSHNRSFHITLNGKVIFNKSEPIIPHYGIADQYTSAVRMGSSNTMINLVSTPDAKKPPIISAWELFLISDLLNSGTNNRDVNGLQELQDTFKTLQDWTGDPCHPKNYSWEWVTCNSDASPRIIGLNLTGYGLTGELTDFSSLDSLQTIDLSNNMLNGVVPSFLAKLPDLQELNLAENDFSSIPSSLVQNSNIKLDVSGNLKLKCTSQACSPAPAPQPQAQPEAKSTAAPPPQDQMEAKENSLANTYSKKTIMSIITCSIIYATALVAL